MSERINNTTTFPITAPATDDLLIGTDVSDTSNNAGGETVNFTAGDIAALAPTPLNWEPYDSASGGWSEDGDAVLYDSASDGTVGSVTTPATSDEYEYVVEVDGAIHSSAGSRDLVYRITYSDATTEDTALYTGVPTATAVSGRKSIGSHDLSFFLSSDVTTKRVSQVSVLFLSASITTGTIRVWRRRAAFA